MLELNLNIASHRIASRCINSLLSYVNVVIKDLNEWVSEALQMSAKFSQECIIIVHKMEEEERERQSALEETLHYKVLPNANIFFKTDVLNDRCA